MKRLWLVLLSVGLTMTFSASAFAIDVKVSGSFYAAGMYQNKTTFVKDGYYLTPDGQGGYNAVFSTGDPSTAFFYQRLRVQTDFIVSPSLKLVTRFNALERIWGGGRTDPKTYGTSLDTQSAATRAENENIGFDWAYIEYTSPIGLFMVGYQDDGAWGTVFGDSTVPQGMITWAAQMNGWTAFLQAIKINDHSKSAVSNTTTVTDNDTDKYTGGIFYEWKGGQAGLLAVYFREAGNRPLSVGPFDIGILGNVYSLQPYAKINIGPVKIQAEVDYAWGDIKVDQTNPFTANQRVDNLAAFLDASVDVKMFYFGGSAAYVAGNDWSKSDVIKGGFLTGGMDWNPTLILFNNERHYWAGAIPGNNLTSTYMNFVTQQFGLNDTGMYNAWFFQGRVGVRPIDKLDILASISYAVADNRTIPTSAVTYGTVDSDVYGTEIDLVGNYKITNNLSYFAGVGYLFTGAYFKGLDPTSEVRDNYMLINKLTLTF
jgi:hypothetical protein